MGNAVDFSEEIAARVRQAAEEGVPLAIRGGGSKAFYGRACTAQELDLNVHYGVVDYAPTELTLTARTGTSLAEIETVLAQEGQMFAFEPPHFGGQATLGGAVACGLSGPRRPFSGAVRDTVLGIRLVNGEGEILRFGGSVLKNVAGYDVSRLMVGALGTLGVLLEVTIKVVPKPAAERTVRLDLPMDEVFSIVETSLRKGLPISATAHDGTAVYIRLSGAESTVERSVVRLGGEGIDDGAGFWRAVRDQRLTYFTRESAAPLWRLALPPGTAQPRLDGDWFQEWAGRQLWLSGDVDQDQVWRESARLGGHAVLFRGGDRSGEVFQPLSAPLERLHRRLKRSFDPKGLFNPGRLYHSI